jgi:hypothetical protein
MPFAFSADFSITLSLIFAAAGCRFHAISLIFLRLPLFAGFQPAITLIIFAAFDAIFTPLLRHFRAAFRLICRSDFLLHGCQPDACFFFSQAFSIFSCRMMPAPLSMPTLFISGYFDRCFRLIDTLRHTLFHFDDIAVDIIDSQILPPDIF